MSKRVIKGELGNRDAGIGYKGLEVVFRNSCYLQTTNC